MIAQQPYPDKRKQFGFVKWSTEFGVVGTISNCSRKRNSADWIGQQKNKRIHKPYISMERSEKHSFWMLDGDKWSPV